MNIVSSSSAVASISLSKRKFTTPIIVVALTLGLFSSMTGAAQATAQEEPGAKANAVANQSKVAKPLEQNPNAGMLAMAEGSTSTLSVPATASDIGAFASNGSGQFEQQSLQVMSYIQKHNRQLRTDEAVGFARAIVQFGSQYGVDYRLLTSIIATESSFRRDAISSSGAIGMGQLKPDTARWLGVMNPYDPVDNIAGTARFLAWLVHRYNGKLEYAISAYYQGPGHVDRKGISPVCIPYLQKVNRALGGLL